LSAPPSPLLSPSQLAALAELGEERSAPAGELLYQVGDRTYPFVANPRGGGRDHRRSRERARPARPVRIPWGAEPPVGQTVFVNALVTEPLEYIAVERAKLRKLLDEDGR